MGQQVKNASGGGSAPSKTSAESGCVQHGSQQEAWPVEPVNQSGNDASATHGSSWWNGLSHVVPSAAEPQRLAPENRALSGSSVSLGADVPVVRRRLSDVSVFSKAQRQFLKHGRDSQRSILLGEARNSDNCIGAVEEHPLFQNMTLFVIVLNAIWIAVDTQYNHKSLADEENGGRLPLQPYSDWVEHFFCAYFTIEVVIRFVAFRSKWLCIRDKWFVFDITLVAMMVLETWIMPFIAFVTNAGSGANTGMFTSMRLLRLLRLTRMARLMRFFPELMTLVKGMISATQAVGFILLFLIMVTYIFAILFTVQVADPTYEPDPEGGDPTAKEMFSNIGSSMMTLFTNGVLGDNLYQTLMAIRDESVALMWAFVLFFCISSMTLLNMLIGVLCAVIDETAKAESEAHQVYELKSTLKEAFRAVDSSNDGTISADEWSTIRTNQTVRSMFEGMGIDSAQLDQRMDQLQETLFSKSRPGASSGEKFGLSFDEFMERVIDLKWGTPASALDLESLKAQVVTCDKELRTRLIAVENSLERVAGARAAVRLANPGSSLQPQQQQEAAWAKPSLSKAKTPPTGSLAWSAHRRQFGSPSSSKEIIGPSPCGASDWLQEVPTELLLHVLKLRTEPPP